MSQRLTTKQKVHNHFINIFIVYLLDNEKQKLLKFENKMLPIFSSSQDIIENDKTKAFSKLFKQFKQK